jgi:hypothetical protein
MLVARYQRAMLTGAPPGVEPGTARVRAVCSGQLISTCCVYRFRHAGTRGPPERTPLASRGNTHCARHRQNRPARKQHRLKAASRPARARIIATQLFDQLLVAVHDALPALYARLRREAVSTLAGPLKRTILESVDCVWWSPPCHETCVAVPPAADDQRNRNARCERSRP